MGEWRYPGEALRGVFPSRRLNHKYQLQRVQPPPLRTVLLLRFSCFFPSKIKYLLC